MNLEAFVLGCGLGAALLGRGRVGTIVGGQFRRIGFGQQRARLGHAQHFDAEQAQAFDGALGAGCEPVAARARALLQRA